MAGAVLAVPAIGLTMIYEVLRFVNFSVASHMAVGAFAGYMLNAWLGLPATLAVLGAFIAAGVVGIASDHVALRPLRGYSALTIAIASIALLFLFLTLTTTGKAMRAVADNPMLADSKGIAPDRMARLAVGLGMGMA